MAIQKITRATKPSNPSPDSAPGAQQAPRTPPAPAPTPFFPYARYTSLVGVHASLLAFTAIFLPRSAFADFSSPAAAAQKRKDPLVLMTESPARSLAWMCLGCLVLQLWWAGWIREWRLEATLPPIQTAEDGSLIETESQKAERILKQKQWDRQKANDNGYAVLATLAASVAFHVVAVLFGAPSASHVLETYMLSLLLAVLTVYPSVYALGLPSLKADTDALVRRMAWVRLYAELSPRTPVERALVYPAVGTFLGCWTGVIPIGLDWDRPWQAWPLTPAWGALGGYVLGSMWALVVSNVKHVVGLGISARREDEQVKKTKKKTKNT